MTRYSQYRIAFGVVLVAAFVSAAGLLLRAEPPQAVGTWASIGATPESRIGGAAVALADGRTLIAGGSIQGTPTDTVVIFNPADGSFASAGQLLAPRVGHTATLLDDGRVLIVGGTVAGLLRNDLELFDPSSGTSVPSATMPQPRSGHAAARLADGTVLIAGGTTTDDVVLQTAEIYDPSADTTTPTTLPMLMPRTGASATTLIDGRVLIAGGNNGSADLASAEIYQPWSQLFEAVDTGMSVARSGHAAVLLPWNNSVLIAGGSSNDVAQLTSDLFLPAEFPDPYSYGIGHFGPTGSMAAPRVSAVAAPHIEGYAVAMGGGAPDAEVYRFATVKTDKDDYAPGVKAIISGSGWEYSPDPDKGWVTLVFQEDPAVHEDYVLHVKADSNGNIYWDQWAPELHDLNVRFYLMAKQVTAEGERRAQTTFTDGNQWTLTISPTSVSTLSTSTFTLRTTNTSTNNEKMACVTVTIPTQFTSPGTPAVVFSSKAGWTVSRSGQVLTAKAASNSNTDTLDPNERVDFSVQVSAPASTTGSPFTWNSSSFGNVNCSSGPYPPLVSPPAVTVTGANAAPVASAVSISGTAQYGQLLTGNYTYSDANSDAQGTSTFRWLRNGSTVVGTSLTYTTVSADVGQTLTFEVTPVAATGTSPGLAVQSSGVTIAKAPLTVTASSHTVNYGDPVPTAAPSYATFVSPDNAAGIDTPPICTTTYTTTSAALSSQSTSCSGGSDNNYAFSFVAGTVTVNKRNVTATAGSGSNVYDGATHSSAACVVSGAFIGGLSCVNSPASVGPGVGTTAISPITSGADLANFTVTPVDGSYTISPAEVTATAGSGSNVYDGATHSPAACVVSGAFIGGLSCVNSPASVGPGVGTTAISPITSGADLANFTVTPVDGSYTISPAEVTATAGSGSNAYDGATHSPAACVVSGAFIGGLSCVNSPASVGPGVGTTAISPITSGADLANFTVTPVDGSYTISPAEVTATAGSGSNAYDGATHSPAACVVSGAFIGGLSCVNSPASVGPGVGTTAISPITSGADLANFTVTPVAGSYTISPAEVTATVGSGSNAYDGATHSPAACVVSGAFIGVLSCVNSPASVGPGVGTTAISPITSGADLANFTVTPVDGSYTISKATSTTTTVGDGPFTYDGTTHTGGSGTATGAGGLSTSATSLTYTGDQINVGTYSVTAHYAGDANHFGSDGDPVGIDISKAASTTTTVGDGPFVYTGSTQTGGSGTVSGAGVITGSATVTYSGDQVNVGTYSVTAHYAGDANHFGSDGAAVGIEITKASSATTTVGAGPFVYTGSTQTGGSGTVTGAGVITGSATVTYSGDQVNVGTYSVTAHYAGDANHFGSDGAAVGIDITKASSATTTVGAGPFVYDTTTHSGGSGTVTGIGGLSTSATSLTYTGDQVNVGTYYVTAHYAGDANHFGSDGVAAGIEITKALSTTTTGGAGPFVYDTTTHSGGSGTVTGIGGLSTSATSLTYTGDQVNAGTYYVTAHYSGDANHFGSDGDPVGIDITKASSTTTTVGAGPFVYTGITQTGGSGTVTGPGVIIGSATVTYSGNQINVGTYYVTAHYAGDANHNPSDGAAVGIEINKANAVVVVSPYNVQWDGNEHTATHTIAGVNGETGATVGTVNVSNTAHTIVGTYAGDSWSFTGGANYNNIASRTITDVISTGYCFNGFLPPIGGSVETSNGGSFVDPVRAFKLGSTIPVKFLLNSRNGSSCGAVVTTGIHTLQAIYYSNSVDSDPAIDASPTDAATTGSQFRLTNPEWHFNLSTKGVGFKAGTWLLKATLQDGSLHSVWITIKK